MINMKQEIDNGNVLQARAAELIAGALHFQFGKPGDYLSYTLKKEDVEGNEVLDEEASKFLMMAVSALLKTDPDTAPTSFSGSDAKYFEVNFMVNKFPVLAHTIAEKLSAPDTKQAH